VKRNWQASAVVTVVNELNQAVAAATVTGDFARNGAVFSAGRTGTTSAAGTATITSGNTKASTNDVLRFCVTSVVAAGLQYDAGTSSACGTVTVG
jgi:hypothetical protein